MSKTMYDDDRAATMAESHVKGKKMIAFCGLDCHECGAFMATKNDDDEKRSEVAKIWSKQFGADIKPADINCDGCHSDGENIFAHCKVCEIRKCGKEKNVDNCAYCAEYPCEKLGMVFNMMPDAKKRLDETKNRL